MRSLQCYEVIHGYEGLTILLCGEKSVNPLLDGTSLTKREPEKKDPLCGSFFSYRPSAGAAPWSVPTQQLTGEAWRPACRAILPLHSNTTGQARHGQLAEQFYLFIQTPHDRRGMASLQSNSTFSFKHHLTGEAFLAWSSVYRTYVHYS